MGDSIITSLFQVDEKFGYVNELKLKRSEFQSEKRIHDKENRLWNTIQKNDIMLNKKKSEKAPHGNNINKEGLNKGIVKVFFLECIS